MTDYRQILDRTDGIFYNAPPTTFDPVIGYRWAPQARILALAKSELIYENRIRFNNYRYHCRYDYQPCKRSPRVFRFIVLGDSFTNGMCMQTTWPESLQDILRARADAAREVEVYAFPSDGGGILNWHEVFMRQILPDFEFDALILGDTVNDAGNTFIVTHSTDTGIYIGFFDYEKRPTSPEDLQTVFPSMTRYYDIVPDAVMDELAARARARLAPASPRPADYTRNLDPAAYFLAAGADPDGAALTAWYGERRLAMLARMTDECRKRGAPVIYYSMPRRDALLLWQEHRATLRQQACAAALARQFGMEYFDGYEAFRDVPAEEIVDLHWLKHDGHWAMPAASLFALRMAGWIARTGIVRQAVGSAA